MWQKVSFVPVYFAAVHTKQDALKGQLHQHFEQ